MKRILFVCIFLLLLAPILMAGDYKKDIPVETAMKAFCGTWFNDSDKGTQKDIYKENGTYEWYYLKSGTEPTFTGSFKIEKHGKTRKVISCLQYGGHIEVILGP